MKKLVFQFGQNLEHPFQEKVDRFEVDVANSMSGTERKHVFAIVNAKKNGTTKDIPSYVSDDTIIDSNLEPIIASAKKRVCIPQNPKWDDVKTDTNNDGIADRVQQMAFNVSRTYANENPDAGSGSGSGDGDGGEE